MNPTFARALALCACTYMLGCGSDGGPAGPHVEVGVAPLNLPGVAGVEYALAVFNTDPLPHSGIFAQNGSVVGSLGNLVWQQASLTSNDFGDAGGGDISYVGTCDASASDNWVALVLKQIDVGPNGGSWNGNGPFADADDDTLDDQNTAFTTSPGSNDGDPDFQNPSPYNAPLVLKFPCHENADTAVTFNLTVMRDANQGFFDIAVNFEDVFCSMKVDTCDSNNKPIALLFGHNGDEDNGSRVETAVIASACSAGTDDASTVMWMGALRVSCAGGVSFTIDPTGGASTSTAGAPGNHCVDVPVPHATGATAATGSVVLGPAGYQNPVVLKAGSICYAPKGDGSFDFDRTNGYVLTADSTLVASQTSAGTVFATSQTPVSAGNLTRAGNWLCDGTLIVDGVPREQTGMGFQGSTGTFTGGSDGGFTSTNVDICYALYWGQEALQCGQQLPCNKEYWNVALNLDDLEDAGLASCEVTTAITASSTTDAHPFVAGQLQGPGNVYGYVGIDAALTTGAAAPTCFQGPMGSTYAPIRYGATPDVLGSTPFPQLCYRYTQAVASPVPLGLGACP